MTEGTSRCASTTRTPGCNQEGRGERLFGADGEPTPCLDGRLKFVRQYQVQFDRTLALCRRLTELELLEPMQASITLAPGNTASPSGFLVVGRDELKGLPRNATRRRRPRCGAPRRTR